MTGLSWYRIVTLSVLAFGMHTQAAWAQVPDDCPTDYFAIRSDFNDLGPFACPLSRSHAQGALLSETYNALTYQNSASLDGLVAAVHKFPADPNNYFLGMATGVFVQGDLTYQFQPTPKQAWTSDTITSGAFAQFTFANQKIETGFDSFRVRGGEIDASTGSRSMTFVGEWLPSYIPLIGKQKDFGLITVYPAPEVMVQYDDFLGGVNKPALFSARDSALRIGPQLLLQSWFTKPDGKGPFPNDWLYKITSLVTLHEAWDAYTGRYYRWTAVSLTYNVAEYFGVSASYGYGNSEQTGALMNQVKLGLSGKW
jgi:hypothetical protein